jgi:DNA helicase-2/ATP-dependent DNA helicase PcrA
VPQRGIGEKSMSRLLARAVKSGSSIWDAIPDALAAKELTSKTAESLSKFRHMMDAYRQRFHTTPVSLTATFQDLLHEINYEDEIARQYSAADQQLARSAVLEEFVAAVQQYEQATLKPSLDDFLDQTTLDGNDREFGEEETVEKPAIKLMTLHSAKGLEFPRVYLVGLEEGILPHKRSIADEMDDSPQSIEEERRLAYVGITRARDFLTISFAKTRMKWGKRYQTKPSRFLEEMQRPLEE